jgi:hypothetical protein
MSNVLQRYGLSFLVLVAISTIPVTASGNIVNEEKGIFIVRPVITEPAWGQTAVYLNTFLFNIPNASTHPSPQAGLSFTPGFTWLLLDRIELNVGFPLLINPDETGQRELDEADGNPTLEKSPAWDSHPDFDFPGMTIGLKALLAGKKGEDKFFFAAGVTSSIPLPPSRTFETNFMPPKTDPYHTDGFRLNPYISLAYNTGRFTPQLQLGYAMRFKDESYDPKNPPAPGESLTKGEDMYGALFFNLALPFAMVFEGTAPMLEINGVAGKEGTQLFITPAVSFLPRKSPALLSFALMIPVLDSAFRENEGFRAIVNFSYRFDALSIPGPQEPDAGTANSDGSATPPALW